VETERHTFLILVLGGGEKSDSHPGRRSPPTPTFTVQKAVSGRVKGQYSLLPLPRIKPRFLGHPACSLEAVPTECDVNEIKCLVRSYGRLHVSRKRLNSI
jgi:hypothetical protein